MVSAQDISNYYREHLDDLSFGHRFHFANRILAWTGEPWARELLIGMKDILLPPDQAPAMYVPTLKKLLASTPRQTISAYELRLPFFQKYEWLFGYHEALFRVRHALEIYHVDLRQSLLASLPKNFSLASIAELASDHEALTVLSTFAVNTLYVSYDLFSDTSAKPSPETFLQLSRQYDTSDPEQRRLYIYLLTHCIIAHSRYYLRAIENDYKPIYTEMLESLENFIYTHFDDLSLDTKLEFLVCCRIIGKDSPLFERIYAECEQSLSPNGTFLVDTVNHFSGNSAKHTFEASEHRNVLYIMSTTPFTPHPITVST